MPLLPRYFLKITASGFFREKPDPAGGALVSKELYPSFGGVSHSVREGLTIGLCDRSEWFAAGRAVTTKKTEEAHLVFQLFRRFFGRIPEGIGHFEKILLIAWVIAIRNIEITLDQLDDLPHHGSFLPLPLPWGVWYRY
ncbi:MAG: hypothetical protein KM310_00215 [Clostridiales bacterium]|nr:hypothetical protein [Clostridiales bacterium]